jgi:F-type H+-transporting ATPase subunit alpha
MKTIMPGSPEDWLTQAQSCITRANLGPRVDAIGRVESIGDGVAMVSGLPDARLDELLYFARGQTGSSTRSTGTGSAACCSTMPPRWRQETP